VNGTHALTGKLTFQACNDQVCLAPATVPVEIAVSVTGGAPGSRAATPDTEAVALERGPPAAADTTPPPAGTGFTTTPPGPGASRSAVADNPLSRALDRGGWAAFVALFLIGLALNLTPCVYPMIGVTVSIFGARRAAPPLQIFGHAVLYVLGMAVMYSTLGLVAALTGGLFGGLLGNPVVLVGIGGLLIALSLSMFGLYQLQAPPALLNRLGGTAATSAAGVFGSGLVVGIFAAPCVGPPVIALLAVVGAKGDPWYGFWSFFVLAMGLGAPYLVLGTFTNLLRSLPRSGEWLAWTEKVFGTILLSLGVFYTLLGLAPAWAPWVAPLALLVGGITLGFIERSADARRGFFLLKRVGGAAAVAAGVFLIATALSERIAFEPFSPAALDAILKSGRPVMLDFTASWCVPCHELERLTFTDRRVREAARAFRAFRVDLTHYDSPESERWRRMFGISGVPTVLFLKTDGSEVRAARVEGFIPPEGFLARMRVATEQAGQDSTR
jgi:thiol:disulfide interchange protein DsbD